MIFQSVLEKRRAKTASPHPIRQSKVKIEIGIGMAKKMTAISISIFSVTLDVGTKEPTKFIA